MGGDNAQFMGKYMTALETMNKEAVEYIRGIPVVKVFQQTIYSFKNFHAAIEEYEKFASGYALKCRIPLTGFTVTLNGTFVLLIPVAMLILSGVSGQAAYENVVLDFLFYSLFTPVCATMMNRIMFASEQLMAAKSAVSRVEEILQEQPLKEPEHPMIPADASIVFSDVSFAYPGAKGNALNHISFEVPIRTQRIRFTVRVLDRSVVSIADESALKALVGYANGTNSGVEQYVNPYEYVKPTMPTELKFNERTGNGDATQVVTYTTKDANHLLVWSFDEFRPSYNGGLIYVTAKLIGVDGNVQSYKIPFLVKRMLANNMTSAKTTKNSSGKTVLTTTSVYNSAVENSVAKTAFSIDPNDPTRLTMPFAYIVTFTVSTPEYDTSTGKIKTETVIDADGKTIVRDKYNVLTDPETLEFFYAIVSMPADTSYTVKSSGITTNADGKSAIVQLADQERISVGIKQINSSIAPTGITADSDRKSVV